MKNKLLFNILFSILLLTFASTAFALPNPKSAYYPRGGMLTLSTGKEKNNTYAFRPSGKTDGHVLFFVDGAYSNNGRTAVTIQLFVVNKWGNWIAFGAPETMILDCEPSYNEFRFTIRQNKPFCIVVTSYGVSGSCMIPYHVMTQ